MLFHVVSANEPLGAPGKGAWHGFAGVDLGVAQGVAGARECFVAADGLGEAAAVALGA
jgi:hypothetical protein